MSGPQWTFEELAASLAEVDQRLDAVELQAYALAAQVALLQARQAAARIARRAAEEARPTQLARWHANDQADEHDPEPEPDTQRPVPAEDVPDAQGPEGRGR